MTAPAFAPPQAIPTTAAGTDFPWFAEDANAEILAPTTGIRNAGLVDGNPLSAGLYNALVREPMRWVRALYSRAPFADAGLFGSWIESGGSWVVTSGLAAYLPSARVWIDANATGALRIEPFVGPTGPHTFTASVDTYIGASLAVLVPGNADLSFQEVAIGDPAPAPLAGFVQFVRVRTDPTTITVQERLLPTIPTLRSVGAASVDVDSLECGSATISGALSAGSAAIAGALSASSATLAGALVAGSAALSGALAAGSAAIVGALSASSASAATLAAGTLSVSGATTANTLGVSGLLTATGGLSLPSGADVTGSAGSIVSVETLDTGSSGNAKAGDLSLYDRGATYSATAGRVRWDGVSLMVGDGSNARALAPTFRGYDATFTGTNSINDTTAVVSVKIQPGAKVSILINWSASVAVAVANCNYRLQISGIFGTAEPDIVSFYLPNPVSVFALSRVFEWTPTDTWPAAATTETYAFLVRLGRSGVNDLTATGIGIAVSRGLVV